MIEDHLLVEPVAPLFRFLVRDCLFSRPSIPAKAQQRPGVMVGLDVVQHV